MQKLLFMLLFPLALIKQQPFLLSYSKNLKRLQTVQNSAARLLTRGKRYNHITPRIDFKVLLITFKAAHDLALDYILELLISYDPVHSLISSVFLIPG